jgi:hypothetical protein
VTFFLPERPAETGRPKIDAPVPSYGADFAAAFTADQIRRNVWNRRGDVETELLEEIETQIGGPPGQPPLAGGRRARSGSANSAYRRRAALAAIVEARNRDPEMYMTLPTTAEEYDAEVRRRLLRDLGDAEALMSNAPEGRFGAQTLGGLASGMADPMTLSTLPAGLLGIGGKTVLGAAVRGAAAEGGLSVGTEFLDLDQQQRQADFLGIEGPNAAVQLTVAGLLGGGLGGVTGAASRFIEGRLSRNTATGARLGEGEAAIEQDAAIAAAQTALERGETPPPVTAASPSDAAILNAIIGVESGGNPTAQNPNSSARGLGQFIASTWLDMIRRHRPDLARGRTDSQLLSLRDDPNLNAEMALRYMQENRAALKAQGLPSGPGEIYLSHFLGPGGAQAILRAPLNAPIASIIGRQAVEANRGIRFGGKPFSQFTAGDLRRWAQHKMRAATDPNAPTTVPTFASTSRGFTGDGQVVTGTGTRIEVKYEVVDASLLRQASGDLQPRDRSRINSDAWVADTAARLDPALLMPAPTADRGAPIVGPDGIVESGNGRVRAIEQAYERFPDRAEAYRGAIESLTGQPIPEGVARPVLIARRTSDLPDEARRQFVIDAQDSGVAELTPTELAQTTSRQLTAERLSRLDLSARLTDPANGAVVRDVLAALPASQRNRLFDPSGALNAEGRRRLAQAFFARAWDAPDILARYAEAEQAGELRTLLDALEEAAPGWAALRAEIEAGLVEPALDITAEVLGAMRLIAAARDVASRTSLGVADAIEELLAQVDLIEGPVSPLVAALVRKFAPGGRAAPAEAVARFLSRYAAEARSAGRTGDMLGAAGPAEVLRRIDPDTFGELADDFARAPAAAEDPADSVPADLAPESYATGALSPEAEAADLALAEELRLQEGPFGPVFDDIRNDPEAAVTRLLDERQGEVPAAYVDADFGEVAFVWGRENAEGRGGFGLAHIAGDHDGETLSMLPQILREGTWTQLSRPDGRPGGRVQVDYTDDQGWRAIVALDHAGADKRWVLTAYRVAGEKDARRSGSIYEPTRDASPNLPDATGQRQGMPEGADDQGLTLPPPNPEMDALLEAAAALRGVDWGDIEIARPDGSLARASEILNDIDDDMALVDVVQACNPGRIMP